MRTKPVAVLKQKENISFYVERKPNFSFYDSDFWEVILPNSGTVETSCDGRKRIISRGMIAFFAPGVKRRITLRGEDGEYISVRVTPDMLKETFEYFDPVSYEVFSKLTFYVHEVSELHVQSIIESINSVHIAEEDVREALLKKLNYAIFLPLIPFRPYNGGVDVVQRALSVMNDARNIALRLPDVAEKVGCSEEYLVRCFKKSGMDTPNTIFKGIKLRYAKSVLTSKKISVSEVSALIGFRSVGHFNKLYFSEFGVCPGADKTR
ncbi:MAG: helix-turn-helix transcriptional regulator [Clostridia bacterium]|nr:helix-turn-helix transcriptional regulator [Clostridia bacterium]MBR2968440.1 helix-turn-helix transcriptional regulator [Clostridia bacterium]